MIRHTLKILQHLLRSFGSQQFGNLREYPFHPIEIKGLGMKVGRDDLE